MIEEVENSPGPKALPNRLFLHLNLLLLNMLDQNRGI